MVDIKGKTAVITGAAQGIGKEIAIHLAKEGCNVVVGDNNYEEVKKVACEIEELGFKSLPVDVDTSRPSQVQHLINRGMEKFGSIDILVNNAAQIKKFKFLDYSIEDWTGIINVSLNGYFYCTQFAAKEMQKSGGGKIVNITSLVGVIAHGGLTAYAIAKAGITSMTKLVGMELKKHNISINAIAPGPVETPLMKNVMNKLPAQAISKTEDIAKAVVWLVKTDNNMINGNIIDLGSGVVGG